MKVLFVSWDGPDVNYLESLFAPIFVELKNRGVYVSILHFSWGPRKQHFYYKDVCNYAGLEYMSVKVLRKPFKIGYLVTFLYGAYLIRRQSKRWQVDVVMPRSLLPALMVIWSRIVKFKHVVYDSDGFAIDERVEFSGLSAIGFEYRFLRDVEAQIARLSKAIVVRTNPSIEVLRARMGPIRHDVPFYVVKNGRSSAVFKPIADEARSAVRASLSIADGSKLIIYVGSLGEQYCLEKMLQFVSLCYAADSTVRFLILTTTTDVVIHSLLIKFNIDQISLVRRVPPSEVAKYIAISDLGISFRKPSFSVKAVAPIKTGEYLLCGIPVVFNQLNNGIEQSFSICGLQLEDLSDSELFKAATWFVSAEAKYWHGLKAYALKIGLQHFSLTSAVNDYEFALRGVVES